MTRKLRRSGNTATNRKLLHRKSLHANKRLLTSGLKNLFDKTRVRYFIREICSELSNGEDRYLCYHSHAFFISSATHVLGLSVHLKLH